MSLIIRAAAYRAKCRKIHGESEPKVRIRMFELGCHKQNRGGEYPSGLRVQDLLRTSSDMGIVQEEADHKCIAVDEVPLHEILTMRGYVSTLDYNIQQCAKDELLHGIYDEPLNKVHYSLLVHNHVMTICRAFLTKQLWRLASIVD